MPPISQILKGFFNFSINSREYYTQAGRLNQTTVKALNIPQLETHNAVIIQPCDKPYCRVGNQLCKNGFHPNGAPCGKPTVGELLLHYTKGYKVKPHEIDEKKESHLTDYLYNGNPGAQKAIIYKKRVPVETSQIEIHQDSTEYTNENWETIRKELPSETEKK